MPDLSDKTKSYLMTLAGLSRADLVRQAYMSITTVNALQATHYTKDGIPNFHAMAEDVLHFNETEGLDAVGLKDVEQLLTLKIVN